MNSATRDWLVIVRLDGLYMAWSPGLHRPLSLLMSRPQIVPFLWDLRGFLEVEAIALLDRCDRHGTSLTKSTSAEDVLRDNRAGLGDTELSTSGIIRQYRAPMAVLDGRVLA